MMAKNWKGDGVTSWKRCGHPRTPDNMVLVGRTTPSCKLCRNLVRIRSARRKAGWAAGDLDAPPGSLKGVYVLRDRPPKRVGACPPRTLERNTEIVRRYNEGQSNARIAREMGLGDTPAKGRRLVAQVLFRSPYVE